MRRAKGLRLIFLLLLLLLAGRLYYVQILCADELTAAAHSQQMIPVVQENGKGTIYDRNMTPMTGTDRVYYYLIHKDNLTAGAMRQLARMEAEPAGQKGEDYLVYRTGHYVPGAGFVLQKQWKAYGFCVDVRYGENQAASALVTDLDEMYAHLLQKGEPAFYFLGNGAGDLVRGTGMTEKIGSDGAGPAGLITTIDLDLQKEIEGMFEDADVNGCAVVTDTKNGQVLAMVGRGGEEVSNLTVEKSYPLGVAYELVRRTATILNVTPAEAASALGLGETVFDDYPGEDTGELAGKKTTATAVQLSRLLTMLASQGRVRPLTLVISTARAESIPCMEMTGTTTAKLAKLRDELAGEPLIADGWAVGYGGQARAYTVVIHVEESVEKKIYEDLAQILS